MKLPKKLSIKRAVLTRSELRKTLGGFGSLTGSNHVYKCSNSTCNLYDPATGISEPGQCAWDLSANPICFCKTDKHPTPQPTTRESVCIQWMS